VPKNGVHCCKYVSVFFLPNSLFHFGTIMDVQTSEVDAILTPLDVGPCNFYGRAVAQVVSHLPLTAQARVRAQDGCGIFGGQSGTGTG
jgi:hypothetical protein